MAGVDTDSPYRSSLVHLRGRVCYRISICFEGECLPDHDAMGYQIPRISPESSLLEWNGALHSLQKSVVQIKGCGRQFYFEW